MAKARCFQVRYGARREGTSWRAGALLQIGWDAVYGNRRSERLKRAASASRQAELRANFVKLRAVLAQNAAQNGD